MGSFSRSHPSTSEHFHSKHRFEHWYRDNQVYLITARTRDGAPAFEFEAAKEFFWDRFNHYASMHGFDAWIVSLLVNHHHAVGYLRVGVELKELMRKLHGSVAKLVNDLLVVRLVPFWGDGENRDYFDGCLRDETQLVRSYRYVWRQSVRHGICLNERDYPHTKVYLSLDESIAFAREHRALMYGIPYARYERIESAVDEDAPPQAAALKCHCLVSGRNTFACKIGFVAVHPSPIWG